MLNIYVIYTEHDMKDDFLQRDKRWDMKNNAILVISCIKGRLNERQKMSYLCIMICKTADETFVTLKPLKTVLTASSLVLMLLWCVDKVGFG